MYQIERLHRGKPGIKGGLTDRDSQQFRIKASSALRDIPLRGRIWSLSGALQT
jgi:hypothetical protein